MSQPKMTASASRHVGRHVVPFILGLAATVGIYAYVHVNVADGSPVKRYLCGHPVEYVETWMLLWAMAALAAKAVGLVRQRAFLKRELLPVWSGQPEPLARAGELLGQLDELPSPQQASFVVRRLRAGLAFVHQRGSAEGLDEHLRAASDSDANEADGSYSLIRYITWAIPILGFLGTVLGITEAIANVTPEQLATSISGVTDGLAIAFDTTALALAYSMCVMFLTFVLDRVEQGLVASVDGYVDARLAHRFQRVGSEGAGLVALLEKNHQAVVALTERLVERQAQVWAKSMEALQSRLVTEEQRQQQRIEQALRMAFEQTLTIHEHRLQAMEKQLDEGAFRVLQAQDRISQELGAATTALERNGEFVLQQAEVFKPLLAAEHQVLRLQETLQTNLQTLAQSGAFEEALHSLTAAVHLLTGRLRLVEGGPATAPAGPRLGSRNAA